MFYKYQLILLGDIENAVCDAIRVCFFEKIHDIGLKDEMFEVIYADSFSEKYLNKQPSFVFYFGKTDHQDTDADILKILIDNGDAVFPIYFGEKFENEVPKVIHIMNGKRYIVDDHEKYINYAFESMKLLRENRKLFISYRRTDSSAVANQLFDAFVKSNYDVFLDTYSINPAKNFQEELHHRMTDCDVLIQLYTNDFKNSEWCNEEITSANQKQIGVVELVWPDCKPDIHNLLCEPVQLSEELFINKNFHNEDCRLTEESIINIIHIVESVRARNLAARQDNLVGEFVEEARKQERRLIQEYRYLVENLENGRIRLFIPAIGIPQSYDCFESLRFRELLNNEKLELFLIYDDLCIRKRWIEHLEWLNKSLEVKTIKKKDFESWLRNN
ncbi:hypothetical protein HMPREF1212_01909 [Parabacteroides sp. HGS0025]|jgi:hypothetical protein|uniref:toll/interleukin-1 receptor domain-containing protein n=1 Tax=Parabacteroides sp. HGS0025 TaxID=1078087 RepID=UPI0006171BE8|nr:toll/interleukin-1 receptor domain-containing protein [Parabacteroides sp. HGS0025]KKB51179.1 hypothetical protein HMPREF1212_01909 [Parabacteroides sp. HGS0025]